jgi:hypothetical protein
VGRSPFRRILETIIILITAHPGDSGEDEEEADVGVCVGGGGRLGSAPPAAKKARME